MLVFPTEKEIRKRTLKRNSVVAWDALNDAEEKGYVVKTTHKRIVHQGTKTISDGIDNESACWALDESLCLTLRSRGYKHIAFRETDTGDLYITPLSNFYDRKKYKTIRSNSEFVDANKAKRGLPIQFFEYHRSLVKLKVKGVAS